MRANEFITERGRNISSIVVDVQPAYASSSDEDRIFTKIAQFLQNQAGPILMFVNAEEHGLTDDTWDDIQVYWDDELGIDYDQSFWSRVQVVDKGYGYFRGWMDGSVPDRHIIQLIRFMYQNKMNDIRDDMDAVYDFMSKNEKSGTVVDWEDEWMEDEAFSINWTSVAQLKRFSGSYIMGGGKEECLREVELLMNAFNIKYKEISEFIY